MLRMPPVIIMRGTSMLSYAHHSALHLRYSGSPEALHTACPAVIWTPEHANMVAHLRRLGLQRTFPKLAHHHMAPQTNEPLQQQQQPSTVCAAAAAASGGDAKVRGVMVTSSASSTAPQLPAAFRTPCALAFTVSPAFDRFRAATVVKTVSSSCSVATCILCWDTCMQDVAPAYSPDFIRRRLLVFFGIVIGCVLVASEPLYVAHHNHSCVPCCFMRYVSLACSDLSCVMVQHPPSAPNDVRLHQPEPTIIAPCAEARNPSLHAQLLLLLPDPQLAHLHGASDGG